jgi:Ser/Thr protein kinase RdoA (MazF antagonist)
VDHAGGGRRGTRATVSAELWEVLAAGWAIPRQRGRDLGGSLNLNLLVSCGDERLVVRVHRPSVSPARLEAIQHARQQLDAAGVPCSALVVPRDGARWARAAGRLVEVERYIPHDGRMHTPPRLARGLPRQLVHGDFWDDNVFFQGETLEFVADFAFMAERARIDDLALTLYCADTEAGLTTSPDRIAALRPLVHGYASGLGNPLTDAEHQALPWATAWQPLWGIGGWVAVLDDQDTARAHAGATSPPSAAHRSWSPTSAPGRPGYPDAGPARRPAERPVLRGDRETPGGGNSPRSAALRACRPCGSGYVP